MSLIQVPPISPLAPDTPGDPVPGWATRLQRGIIVALEKVVGQVNAQVNVGETDLSMNGHRIVNVSDPAAQRDAINKGYLDTRLAGLQEGGSVTLTTISGGDTVGVTLNGTPLSY